jgi:hypothetical protein
VSDLSRESRRAVTLRLDSVHFPVFRWWRALLPEGRPTLAGLLGRTHNNDVHFFRTCGYDGVWAKRALRARASFARKAKWRNMRNETAVKPLKTLDCEKSSISLANDSNDLRPLLRSGWFRSAKSPFSGADPDGNSVDQARFAGNGCAVEADR